MMTDQWHVGVDVGGTFTDIVAIESGTGAVRLNKVASTLDDQSKGVINGLLGCDIALKDVAAFVHGTTVGTNAVLERKGVLCGLITTAGFRDTIELGRRSRPQMYGMYGGFEPLIPRDLRFEVPERMDASGEVIVSLDEAALRETLVKLRAAGVEAVVIHFLHSYANPAHEIRAGEIAREEWPNGFITLGHDILSEPREFERGATAAVNGYIQPLMSRYLSRLSGRLEDNGLAKPLLVMQGNAGTLSARLASDHAAQTVMSGPAAGALAAARIGLEAGLPNLIGCDMGGTSFDVTLIRDGKLSISTEKDIAFNVPVRVPMIDIHTIGAGGGSIARVDASGMLRVGPDSAGSRPGPVCYGRGGTEPTVTDANLVLGRLDPQSMPGIERPASMEEVRAVIADKIGKPLGLNVIEAASAIISVANNHLAGAIQLVSIERGENPRDYALFAFGGAGPLHAAALAVELGVPQVLVPVFPGATSALGCIMGDLRHDFVSSIRKPLRSLLPSAIDEIFAEHVLRGRSMIEREGVPVEDILVLHEAELRYGGQSHVFKMPVVSPGFDPSRLAADFAKQYYARFDIELGGMEAFLATVRTVVLGIRKKVDLARLAKAGGTEAMTRTRRTVVFDKKSYDTPVYRRQDLPFGTELAGPAIIEQLDATTVLDPGTRLRVDALGNLIIKTEDRR